MRIGTGRCQSGRQQTNGDCAEHNYPDRMTPPGLDGQWVLSMLHATPSALKLAEWEINKLGGKAVGQFGLHLGAGALQTEAASVFGSRTPPCRELSVLEDLWHSGHGELSASCG